MVPAVVFTDPEVAWCGLTETQAEKEKREVTVAKFPWAASGRAVTLGFYLVGCLFLLAGFFLGNRGPARVRSEEDTSGASFLAVIFGGSGRRLRWATINEQDETINNSAVCVVLGIVLVFAGFLVDSRHALF